MTETRAVAIFAGPVRCRREEPPLALALLGHTVGASDELLTVTFAFEAGVSPPSLPEGLESARVERMEPAGFRISSGSGHWDVPAVTCHLHREVAPAFYDAIPPRKPHWSRRLFWSILLALLAHPLSKRLLLALRRH
jgi:hypothetical protein